MVPELVLGHTDVAVQKGIDAILAKLGGEDGKPTGGLTPSAPRSAPAPGDAGVQWWMILLGALGLVAVGAACITHPRLAWILFDIISSVSRGGFSGGGGSSGGGGGGGGFSGGGGKSGGGGASAKW